MASKNGQLTFNFALSVSADKAEEVEEMIATHAAWMRETHSLEADGRIHLVDYHVAKAEELKNLLDPSEGTTGNVLYSINEVYVESDGIDRHMAQGMQWEHFMAFAGTIMEYGKVLIAGGSVIQSMNE
jgi:predicted small metal-binding protein